MAAQLTTWAVGFLDGLGEERIPRSISYGTMGITTGVMAVKALATLPPKVSPAAAVAGLFVLNPILIGGLYCLGLQFGKGAYLRSKT